LRAHVEDIPRPLREVRPDCPPELAAGIDRMLAKEPADRWPDIMQAVTGLGGRHLPEHDPMRVQLSTMAMADGSSEASPALQTPTSQIPATSPRQARVTTVAIRNPSKQAPVGETIQLHAVGQDAAGVTLPAPLRWISSDQTVASVSES